MTDIGNKQAGEPREINLVAAELGKMVFMPLNGNGIDLEHPVNRAYWRALFAGVSMLASAMTSEAFAPEEDAREAVIRADALILELRATAMENNLNGRAQ